MNIWERLDRDHTMLHASGTEILQNHGDQPRRNNQFAYFDHEVRRHLAAVEDVIFPLLRENDQTSATAHVLEAEHRELRKELGRLDRTDKTGAWTEDFNIFLQQFEATCQQHDGLENVSRATIDDARARELGDAYEQAKMQHMRQAKWSWNKIGLGVGAAAAVAGAAYAASRAFRSSEDDFELRLETDENVRLISSKKVEGTPVVDANGSSLGKIDRFMVDKYSGRVAYAVLSFNSTFGLGGSLFPIPWPALEYDVDADAYALSITKQELESAPKFQANSEPEFSPEYRRQILVFYRPSTGSAGSRSAFGWGGGEPAEQVQPSASAGSER
jgi:PRC-barrel domain/Hemerythrin HHE cation binding domain